MKNTKEAALKFSNFIHYVDVCDDFFKLDFAGGPKHTAIRQKLARVLRIIRRGDHDWQLDCMNFFCDEYYIHWSHPSHYNKEFLELMREFLEVC